MCILSTTAALGQYYIGNTSEQVIGLVQEKATMITKNYDQNGQLILSWIEHRNTKYEVHFNGEHSNLTYIIPLDETTLVQWYQVVNETLPKAEGEKGLWISYTKTGTFQLRFIYYPKTIVKCFEVTRTNQY